MSFQAATWAVDQEVDSPTAKFVLVLLANYADADGFTFVGQATLARDASMSKRSVVRHMAALESAGLIRRSRRFREDGTRSSDGVYLSLSGVQNQPSDNLTSGQNVQGPSDTSGRDQVPNCHRINLPEEQSANSKLLRVAPKKADRGSRLPDDWVLPADWMAFALTEGLSENDARNQAYKFKDYWLGVAGARGVKRDWMATWRNWIRNSKEWKQHAGHSPKKRGPLDNHFEGMYEAAQDAG